MPNVEVEEVACSPKEQHSASAREVAGVPGLY